MYFIYQAIFGFRSPVKPGIPDPSGNDLLLTSLITLLLRLITSTFGKAGTSGFPGELGFLCPGSI